jgi:hypothetical protein
MRKLEVNTRENLMSARNLNQTFITEAHVVFYQQTDHAGQFIRNWISIRELSGSNLGDINSHVV